VSESPEGPASGQPLWHGRFGEGPADELLTFTVSLPYDLRLAPDDLAGSRAHVHMLERVGPGTLVIVPGDREDVILTLTTAHFAHRLRQANSREAARIASIAAAASNERTASIDGHEGAAIGLVLVMASAAVFHATRKEFSNMGGNIVLGLLAAFIVVGYLAWVPVA